MDKFETWWEREGQEFLFALNTTTDDDIKLVAEVAWKNGAICAEQAEQEPWKCACGANLYIDSNGAPASKAEQTNTQLMEGYRIGLAEMREKCAKVCEQGAGKAVQKGTLSILLVERSRIAAAIRDINFEGDTGFRPVSEMIAEHKQDPKKKAAIERAELRKQVAALKAVVDAWNNVEQEPVAKYQGTDSEYNYHIVKLYEDLPEGALLYAAPVHTVDLTDDEIREAYSYGYMNGTTSSIVSGLRAVIAADREKNK